MNSFKKKITLPKSNTKPHSCPNWYAKVSWTAYRLTSLTLVVEQLGLPVISLKLLIQFRVNSNWLPIDFIKSYIERAVFMRTDAILLPQTDFLIITWSVFIQTWVWQWPSGLSIYHFKQVNDSDPRSAGYFVDGWQFAVTRLVAAPGKMGTLCDSVPHHVFQSVPPSWVLAALGHVPSTKITLSLS